MVSTVGKIILTISFQFKFCIILLRYMLVMSNIMLQKTPVWIGSDTKDADPGKCSGSTTLKKTNYSRTFSPFGISDQGGIQKIQQAMDLN